MLPRSAVRPLVLTVVLFSLATGCGTLSPLLANRDLMKAGRQLDYVARGIDQFGTLSVSGTTLIEPDPDFQLDLNLTAKQIFEQNRIEGYSAIRRFDSGDAQLSLVGELEGLLGQAADTADSAAQDQLKGKIKTVALQALVAQLPKNLRGPLGDLLNKTAAASSASAGDGGRGYLNFARDQLLDAQRALGQLPEYEKMIDAEQDSKKFATYVGMALESAQGAVETQAAASRSMLSALDEAWALTMDAQGSAASSNTGTLSAAPAVITAAATACKNARTKVDSLLSMLQDAHDSTLAAAIKGALDSKEAAKAAVEAVKKEAGKDYDDIKTPQDALAAVSQAVDASQQAASATGTPVAPAKPILKAEEIERSKRLALQRLPDATTMLPNYSGPLDLNLRTLINLTAGDKTTLELARWFSYPHGFGPGKRVYMCLATVNCAPGRDTYEGYMGQVDVYCELATWSGNGAAPVPPGPAAPAWDAWVPKPPPSGTDSSCLEETPSSDQPDAASSNEARLRRGQRSLRKVVATPQNEVPSGKDSLKRWRNLTPKAIAVFPLVDSQVLDLRNSKRQIITAALQAIVNGYPAAGRFLLDFARQREHDVETYTASNCFNTYSNGAHFGFEFSPRLTAQANPSEYNSPPAMILQPQTVPVIVMMEIDEEVISKGANCVVWYQTSTWRRSGAPNADWWPGGSWISRIRHPRQRETEILSRAGALDDAKDLLDAYRGGDENGYPKGFKQMALMSRINFLGSAGIGTNVVFKLPASKNETPTDTRPEESQVNLRVSPKTGWLNAGSTLFVEANNDQVFADGDVVASVGGRPANVVKLSNRLLRVVVPPWRFGLGNGVDDTGAQDNSQTSKEKRLSCPVTIATPLGMWETEPVDFILQRDFATAPAKGSYTIINANPGQQPEQPKKDDQPKQNEQLEQGEAKTP